MTFVNFIYSLISRAPRSSTGSNAFCVRSEEDDSASTSTLLKPEGYLYNRDQDYELNPHSTFSVSFNA